jgi:hypothetical protein
MRWMGNGFRTRYQPWGEEERTIRMLGLAISLKGVGCGLVEIILGEVMKGVLSDVIVAVGFC